MSAARAKGTAFETLVCEGFRTRWPDAHRLGMQGVHDKGDVWLPRDTRLVVEAKCQAKYAGQLSGWLDEAKTEALAAGRDYGVVVHKRYGCRPWQDQFVTTDLWTFLGLLPE